MEQFVRLVVIGGIGMVAGLWVTAIAAPTSAPWLVGVVLAIAGAAVLGAGVRRELTL